MNNETKAMAVADLKDLIGEGDRIYTLVRSVSASGMSRRISVFVVKDGNLLDIDWLLVRAEIGSARGVKRGMYIQGSGMDMCFKVTYDIGMRLYGNGYSLTNTNI